MERKISKRLEEVFYECQKDIKEYIGTAEEITEDIRDSEEFLRHNKIGIYGKVECFRELNDSPRELVTYFLVWKRSANGIFRIIAQSSNADFEKPLIEMPLLYRQEYHKYLPMFVKAIVKQASEVIKS